MGQLSFASLGRCGVAIVCVAAVVASCGSDVVDQSADVPEVAPTDPPPEDQVSEDGTSELDEIAQNRGISRDEAESLIDTQARLSDFADEAIGDPGVLQFQFEADGSGGILIVEPGFDTEEQFPDIDTVADLTVHEAFFNAEQRSGIVEAVETYFRNERPGANLIGSPPYDGYQNRFYVYVEALDESERSEIEHDLGRIADATVGVSDVEFAIEKTSDIKPVGS